VSSASSVKKSYMLLLLWSHATTRAPARARRRPRSAARRTRAGRAATRARGPHPAWPPPLHQLPPLVQPAAALHTGVPEREDLLRDGRRDEHRLLDCHRRHRRRYTRPGPGTHGQSARALSLAYSRHVGRVAGWRSPRPLSYGRGRASVIGPFPPSPCCHGTAAAAVCPDACVACER